jgi:hypothetical protein
MSVESTKTSPHNPTAAALGFPHEHVTMIGLRDRQTLRLVAVLNYVPRSIYGGPKLSETIRPRFGMGGFSTSDFVVFGDLAPEEIRRRFSQHFLRGQKLSDFTIKTAVAAWTRSPLEIEFERTSAYGVAKPAMHLSYPIAPRGEWYGNADFRDTGGEIVVMSPDDFLAQVRPLEVDESSRDNIEDLKRHIASGRTLDPLMIADNVRSGGEIEDGRHRAIAAKELGIETIPVLVFGAALARNSDKPRFEFDEHAALNSRSP